MLIRAFSVRMVATVVILASISGVMAQHSPLKERFDFQGKLLVVACDTDMLASAYVDGKLGPAVGADVLSVIRLGRDPAGLRVSTVGVSNSVTGPPAAVAVTPDGHYAIVLETQGPRPASKPAATMQDLAPGKKITVVDLADPAHPRIAQQIESYERAFSVSINSAGDLAAVSFVPKTGVAPAPLVIYRFAAGKLLHPFEPKLPGFNASDQLSDAEFLHGKNLLALLYRSETHPRLTLLQYSLTNDQITLTPWGNAVDVDPSPFLVKFSPDGRFALVNCMFMDANARGTVTSIQLAVTTDTSGTPRHSVVSHVEAGGHPEGLAISPNGRWVATSNLEESYQPLSDPKQQFFGSLSLFHFDPSNGRLSRVGEFPFDGVLPVVFDNFSRFIAGVSFQHYDNPTAGGVIHFWRIADHNLDPKRVELILLNDSVPVARGPQSMAIVR